MRALIVIIAVLWSIVIAALFFAKPIYIPFYNDSFYKEYRLDDGHDYALIIQLPQKDDAGNQRYKSWVIEDEAILAEYKYKVYIEGEPLKMHLGNERFFPNLTFFQDGKLIRSDIVGLSEVLYMSNILDYGVPVKEYQKEVFNEEEYSKIYNDIKAKNAYIANLPILLKKDKRRFQFTINLPTVAIDDPNDTYEVSTLEVDILEKLHSAFVRYEGDYEINIFRNASGKGAMLKDEWYQLKDANNERLHIPHYHFVTLRLDIKSTKSFYNQDFEKICYKILDPYLSNKDELNDKIRRGIASAVPKIRYEDAYLGFPYENGLSIGPLRRLPDAKAYFGKFKYFLPI